MNLQDRKLFLFSCTLSNRYSTVQCPHCHELFPKNDFEKFYRSGLDAHGVFDTTRADRSLLYNTEHPDPKDPLHAFGVDDGEGTGVARGSALVGGVAQCVVVPEGVSR